MAPSVAVGRLVKLVEVAEELSRSSPSIKLEVEFAECERVEFEDAVAL